MIEYTIAQVSPAFSKVYIGACTLCVSACFWFAYQRVRAVGRPPFDSVHAMAQRRALVVIALDGVGGITGCFALMFWGLALPWHLVLGVAMLVTAVAVFRWRRERPFDWHAIDEGALRTRSEREDAATRIALSLVRSRYVAAVAMSSAAVAASQY